MYYAVYHQREAALLHFLRTGGSPDGDGTGQPPLCIAVANGHTEIVKILLGAGANMDATSQPDGETALHLAIKMGRTDLVDLILSYGPDLGVQTSETSDTPLHYAAGKSGSLAMVVALLRLGAKYDTLNSKGQTPAEAALLASNLHGAVAIINAAHGKRHKLVKEKEMLLKHVQKTQGRFSIGNDLIADIFSAACDPDSTVLVEAIKRDDASLVDMFLDKGSDADRLTAKGDRPIFVALECAGAPVIQALAKHKADVSCRNRHGLTVLQAAFEGPLAQDKEAMSAIFDVLLQNNADASVTYPDGKTLLHLAVSPSFGHTRVAHLLIGAGVKVNAQDNNGSTALHLATHSKSCIDVLLKNGANPRIIDLDQLTPLLYASVHGSKQRESDLESLIKVSDLRRTNADGQTALHLAASNGLEKTVRSLLRARAETTIVDSNKRTPLLLTVMHQQWSVVPLLAIPPSINSWDEDGMSALHHIARSVPHGSATWKDIATAAAPFCERGVSRSMRDRSGATPLIQAIKTIPEDGLPVVEALLAQSADKRASWNCVSHEDHKKCDALYYAVTLKKPIFVEALLKHGAMFTFKEWTPNRGVLDASVEGDRHIMKLLTQYEWARRAGSLRRHPGDADADMPTFSTTFPIKDIKHMIAMGLNVNVLPKSPLGTSMLWAVLRHVPLETSMSPKYLSEAIVAILDAGADPNAGTARGARRSPSPQSPQASRESLPLPVHPLTFLLEECSTVDIDLITLLLMKGAKLSVASPYYGNRLPLHSATKANRIDVVDEFLQQRANVNCEDQNGRTPLFIAAENGSWEIVETLIRRGAKVEVADNEKNTPLHAAASSGSSRIVTALLRAGAKADMKNAKNVSPLACVPESAEEKEKDKMIRILKDAVQKEQRTAELEKQQAKHLATHEARLKKRQEEELMEQARRKQEEEERLGKEREAEVQRRIAREDAQKASQLLQPTPPPKNKQSSSLFRKPSLLFSRSKQPKQASMVSMRITTPTSSTPPQITLTPSSTSIPTLTQAVQPDTSLKPAATVSKPAATSTTSLATQKPLPTPRVDSGVGQKRPSDADKPLPALDRNKSTLDGDASASDRKKRESGHELKDWLALSKMMDNL